MIIKNKVCLSVVIFLVFVVALSVNAEVGTEKLELSLRWRGIVGGKSIINSKEILMSDFGQNAYLFEAELKTVALADILFKIKNEYSTLVINDSGYILPIWWKVKQREKKYKYEEKTDFAELPENEANLQNPLSALFFLRLQDWEVGKSVTVPVLERKKVYPVKVTALSKESLKIYGKTFDTILLDVAISSVDLGISSAKIKEFKIWLTNDDKKFPILMKAETSVGPITVLLDNRKDLMK